jgi:predicted phage baseplate assembly protein
MAPCCQTCGSSSLPCGCCEGTQRLTPAAIFNRPGLPALAYRVGSHGSFFETMKARLATVEVDGVAADGQTVQSFRPLRALTTRDRSDFSIALLDGWATVADLLSFYQERIANEGYLRTATERRSVLELARLVGYTLRPGVAASVYLAYTLDANQTDPTTIAAGARAQSVPGPGETPQSFETSEDLVARREWNNLQVRLQRPQNITVETVLLIDRVTVAGAINGLKAGDPLLFLFSTDGRIAAVRTVSGTEGPAADGRSTIRLVPVPTGLAATIQLLILLVHDLQPFVPGADEATARVIKHAQDVLSGALIDHSADPRGWAQEILSFAFESSIERGVSDLIDQLETDVDGVLGDPDAPPPPPPPPVLSNPDQFVAGLLKPRVAQVANSLQLRRDLGRAFVAGADTAPQMLLNFAPPLRDSYYTAWAGASVNGALPALIGVFALRTSAALFGATVPRQAQYDAHNRVLPQSQWLEWTLDGETTDAMYLDQLHPAVNAGGYAVVTRLESGSPFSQVLRLREATTAQRTAYGVSGKSTWLHFDRDWWEARVPSDSESTFPNDMPVLRATQVWAQSEPLTLAEEPISDTVSGQSIQLGALYNELTAGRWVILSGERADIPGVQGVHVAELMMVAGLVHGYDATLAGDTTHTTLQLATKTAFEYKRETLVIYGNVVQATHGETRNEMLGSGDATAALQTFTLKQPPLTFVSAPTAAGAQSTLAVYVDDVQWRETATLAWLGPKDRGFVTSTDDSGQTSVIFGDGEHGARLPTGVQNVRSVYRSGIGAPGDVRAEQISLLSTRPLGVQAVINPLRASGGADREDRDLARDNAPLAVMALDRLVSVQDYADFTRTFAGIAKAAATRTSDGERELVFLTIAGADDAPIDTTSELYRNLLAALRQLGDPDLPLRVDVRELRALVLSAGIALLPDYSWEPVAAAVRAQLLDVFGFGHRALGQSARLSEVIAAIQAVRGVAWVDVDVFTSIPEKDPHTRELITQGVIAHTIDVAIHGEPQGEGPPLPASPPADVPAFAGGRDASGVLRPTELAIFTPAVADTLILNQLS